MTKRDLAALLDQLRDWGAHTRDTVRNADAFKSLGDDEELSQTVVDLLRAQADNPALQSYLVTTGLVRPQAGLVGPREPEAIPFGQFLQQLSTSMVTAQRNLDAESARYLSDIGDKRHILPSVFRLPKVTAEMKFALQVEQGEQLNLLFYRRDEETVSRNEQGINFEIVSVPAPPDALQAMKVLAPRLDLLLDPIERRIAIDAIRGVTSAPLLKPLIDAAAEPDQLVILALSSQDRNARYLVLYATGEGEHSVGMWLLTLGVGVPPSLSVVYRFQRNNGPEEDVFRALVFDLAQKQRAFFS